MVVSAQHLATEVGVQVLKDGGNAVDAAVAVGYALAVVYPAAGNLGGGGFMTLRMADGRETVIDFRETAPARASQNMYLDSQGKVIPGLSTFGYLAAGVPGTVAGLELARTHYGTQDRAKLVGPAVALAEKGFVLDAGDAEMLKNATPNLAKDPASARIFTHQGQAYQAGETLRQTDLANTLRQVADKGVAGFYQGPVAAKITLANQQMGGLIGAQDLASYRALERAPVTCDYRGFHIISAPPPSSGGTIVCEILNILEGYPLAQWGFRSPQAVHVQIEAMRHAYLDRNFELGDPGWVYNPVARLTDKAYAARLRSAIDLQRAGVSKELHEGKPPHEGMNTTHYSVADAAGNVVSVTYTLNNWFGACVTVPGTGVVLNDEMDDFTVQPNHPNSFGLVQGENNAIAPGKRPLSSMSPTVVMRDGQPVMVLGTPGGSRIITAVLHTLINSIDYGMDLQQAIDTPRFHHQWLPDETQFEPGAISEETAQALRAMGHTIGPPYVANHMAVITLGSPYLQGGSHPPHQAHRFFGATDPRRSTGMALGF